MTRSTLTPDHLLRIEALKIANVHPTGTYLLGPEQVTGRAAVYLAFLQAASSPNSPKPSSAVGKK